jgi:hypothetical protein
LRTPKFIGKGHFRALLAGGADEGPERGSRLVGEAGVRGELGRARPAASDEHQPAEVGRAQQAQWDADAEQFFLLEKEDVLIIAPGGIIFIYLFNNSPGELFLIYLF